MRIYTINNQQIYNILNRLTVDETLKSLTKKIIVDMYNSYIEFISCMFTDYVTYYVKISNLSNELGFYEINNIKNMLSNLNRNIDLDNVYLADVYDILYVASAYDKHRFKSSFYEDIFNKLVQLAGEEQANIYIEDVFDIFESMFTEIETCIMSHIIGTDQSLDVIIYPELSSLGLVLYVF